MMDPDTNTSGGRHTWIGHMLTEIETDLDSHKKQNTFIESIREQFDKFGRLSEKQYEAVERFYERLK